jgi:hypothetical protein
MKILKWFAMGLGVLIMVGGLMIYGFIKLVDAGCESLISDVVHSPNGSLEAVVYTVDCGALTSHLATFLTLRKRGDEQAPDRDAAIFEIGDRGSLPSERYDNNTTKLWLKWLSDSELQVKYPKGPDVTKSEPNFMEVSLQYVRLDK